ncbi:MAG: PRC-barrel domain-containing protein [Ktedonobacterales bacterium]
MAMELYIPQVAPQYSQEQVWLASWLLNRQVVNASSLEPVGRVNDVVFDPMTRRVVALNIQSSLPLETGPIAAIRRMLGRPSGSRYVTLDHILSLNGDIVVVDAAPARLAAHRVTRMPHLCQVCELAIITLHGICLGSLADVLVDAKGSELAGYVVNPTKQAETLMVPLSQVDLAPAMRPASQPEEPGDATETGLDASDAPPAEIPAADASPALDPSLSHLRVIPASPRIRIGDALIMVYEEVEPLYKEAVVVTSQSEVTGSAGMQAGQAR